MSKYTAEFNNINNVNYKIEIETEKGNKTGTLLLSGDPLDSSMDSDGKTLYAPIKSSGMTVSILTRDMPFDLYSGSAMGTKVNVKENDKYIFKGFLTPCAYSMGFDCELEEIQLECVDGIAVLKEIPYSSSDKEIKPFIDIIFNCLKKSNCFKTLYVTSNMQFSASANEAIFERIRVSESNFFEEKDYELQPDNEVAMNCYDVLFQTMQYMGCTLIADGEDVYIIDYDAIRNGKNDYFKYDISGNKIGTKEEITLKQSYHIKEGSYSENGSKVDLTETFNKLTVKDDFYILDDMFESLTNAKNWINITSPNDEKLLSWLRTGRYLENMVFTRKNGKGENESFFVALIKNWTGRIYFVVGKFYKNPLITTYHYNDANNSLMDENNFNSDMKYSKLWDGKGAICIGLYTQEIEESVYNEWQRKFWNNNRPSQYIWNNFTEERKLEEFGNLSGLSKLENKKLTNYILCLNYDNNHILHDQVTNYPYFKVKKAVPSIFGGEDSYLLITGSLIRHDEFNTPFPMGAKDQLKEKNTSIYANESYLWAQLKWGDKYWEELTAYGTIGGKWVDTPTYFKIPYGDYKKEQKSADFFDKELSFANTANSIWGLNENGFYIPAPETENLQGEIELTIFANKDTKGKWGRAGGKKDIKNSYNTYPPKVVLFKDLDIKLSFADEALNEDAASEDTYYTNEVEDYPNINEGEDIECKICTFDNKTPSLSTTDYLDENGKSQYINTLYNRGTNIMLRAEEHIIYKIVNQYEEPRVIYTANLKNSINLKPYCMVTDKTLKDKTFIIDTIQRNYRYNKAEVSMIEKNNKYK